MKNLRLKRKSDLILLFSLLIVTIVILLIFRLSAKKGNTVVVTVSGEVIAEYPLDEDAEYLIDGVSGGTNLLTIKDSYAYISEASCPDKLCVNKGKINTSVESIICLPNEVVISISSSDGDNNSVDAVAE